jgi:hypothetical protein
VEEIEEASVTKVDDVERIVCERDGGFPAHARSKRAKF